MRQFERTTRGSESDVMHGSQLGSYAWPDNSPGSSSDIDDGKLRAVLVVSENPYLVKMINHKDALISDKIVPNSVY